MNMDFKFEVIENIAMLSGNGKGSTFDLKRVSWNGDPPKLEIRHWWDNGNRAGSGLRLTDMEAHVLMKALEGIKIDVPGRDE